MNIEETKTLLSIIRECYPSKAEFNPEGFEIQAKMWQRIFHDVSFSDLGTAFEIWYATEKYAPTPAELNPIAKKLKNPEAFLSSEKAWEIVHSAVVKYGWANETKALATFSPTIKRTVKAVGGWQVICSTPDGQPWSFLRKNFTEAYGEFNHDEQRQELLPDNILKKIHLRLQQNQKDQLDKPGADNEQVS